MTALTKYERLEALGLWRASKDAQRRDVLVFLGNATLVICDTKETPLSHWSLPAIVRLNPGERPALYAPSPEDHEQLECDDDLLIKAIEELRTVIERRRPHPGRLRHWITGGVVAMLVILGVFWLPNALQNHTVSIVPAPVRAAIGARILTRLGRVAGSQCTDLYGKNALAHLKNRVLGPLGEDLVVLSGGVQTTAHLPGEIILINRALFEDFEEPDVAAGFILAESQRRQDKDPLKMLLEHAGLKATFTLLTTGDIPDQVIDSYAETLLTSTPAVLDTNTLLERFSQERIRATPYAYAMDLTGETTVDLIEADPVSIAQAQPLLSDSDWVSLQGICAK